MVVVVVGLAVLVFCEHRCRCRSGGRPIAITFALAADSAAGRGRSGRRVRSGGGGWLAVLATAPVGAAAALPAGGGNHPLSREYLQAGTDLHKAWMI